MFPSPIGVLYISINYTDDVVNRFDFVSVPYWGSLYFNDLLHCSLQGVPVSVPYWGSLYFNKKKADVDVIDFNSFRPLLGFFIFQ